MASRQAKTPGSGRRNAPPDREQRLAEALRANLKRRKAAGRSGPSEEAAERRNDASQLPSRRDDQDSPKKG